ncbi:MAG: hypothetical protein ACE5M4_07355, partial [Anaerolineales bacterium]
WEEVRTRVQSHLASPTAIPEQDLAVYVPLDVEQEPRVRQPLEYQVDEVARLARETLAEEPEPDEAVREEIEEAIREKRLLQRRLPQEIDEHPSIHEAEIEEEAEPIAPQAEAVIWTPPESTIEAGDWDLSTALDPSRLTPLPLVAAALEAVGLDEERFGFLLRYGTFAPAGRKSEIKIAGLGLAEFSRRAADWFSALGASKFPIQVIDEGSGELTVYLLESEPS